MQILIFSQLRRRPLPAKIGSSCRRCRLDGRPAARPRTASERAMALSAYSPLASRPTADLRRSCNGAEPWHPSTSRSRLASSNANSASTPPKRRQRRRLGRPPRPRHKSDERPWSRQSRQRRQVRPGSRTPRRRLRASRRTAGTAEGRRTGAPTSTPTSTSGRPATGSPALARVTPVAITATSRRPVALACPRRHSMDARRWKAGQCSKGDLCW